MVPRVPQAEDEGLVVVVPEMYTQRQQRLLGLPLAGERHRLLSGVLVRLTRRLRDVRECAAPTVQDARAATERSAARRLLMAIAHEWEVIHEEDLDFDDIAGGCAQVLHVRGDGRDPGRTAVAAREERASRLTLTLALNLTLA